MGKLLTSYTPVSPSPHVSHIHSSSSATMHLLRLIAVTVFTLIYNAKGLEDQFPLTNDGEPDVPLLGFGTWNLDLSNASEAVSVAIQAGYRHIDAAAAYYNQELVGKGIADGLKKTGLKRSDIWVTSKLWNDQ